MYILSATLAIVVISGFDWIVYSLTRQALIFVNY
ncbi:hypothetical protein SBA4_4590039 [Candidatus Sulfopaludibacter sp. SbA4]|nr:hypothetical protein SBA4_4590039 [Candidatus Sulfopaludibacter sp. SbA4]